MTKPPKSSNHLVSASDKPPTFKPKDELSRLSLTLGKVGQVFGDTENAKIYLVTLVIIILLLIYIGICITKVFVSDYPIDEKVIMNLIFILSGFIIGKTL